MKDPAGQTLGSRLLRALWLQLLFISLVAAASLLAARYVLENGLVRQALELEAEHFIAALRTDSAYPLPRTRNLEGYRGSNTPDWLKDLAPGLHKDVTDPRSGNRYPVYVSPLDGDRLYLVYLAGSVDRLVLVFGLLPLAAVLLALYLAAWVGYRLSHQAVSPIVALARRVTQRRADDTHSRFTDDYPSGEVGTLAQALDDYAQRIGEFVDRERQFTADASHELRTPITIIRGAAQLLESDPGLGIVARERAGMIRRAAADLGEVLDLLLMLAREASTPAAGPCDVNAVLAAEVERCRPLLHGRPIRLALLEQGHLTVSAPAQAVAMVVGNLLRNAITYTEAGQITVAVLEHSVSVADTGPGIADQDLPHVFTRHFRGRGNSQAGSGIGLAIVARLCDRYGWRPQLGPAAGGGVVASVRFFG